MHNGKDSQQIPRWLQYIDGDGLIYELTLFSLLLLLLQSGVERRKGASQASQQSEDQETYYQSGFHHALGSHLFLLFVKKVWKKTKKKQRMESSYQKESHLHWKTRSLYSSV